jgi:hypothetical protein
MIGLEMRYSKAKRAAMTPFGLDPLEPAGTPSDVELAFACQLATSVWLRQLGDAAASEAISAYVMARCRSRLAQARLRVTLESEFRLCRERLDLCS